VALDEYSYENTRGSRYFILKKDKNFKIYNAETNKVYNVEFTTKYSEEEDSSLSYFFSQIEEHFYVKQADTVWKFEHRQTEEGGSSEEGEASTAKKEFYGEIETFKIDKKDLSYDFSMFKVYEEYLYFSHDYNIKIYSMSTSKIVTTQKVIADMDIKHQIENSPTIMTNKGIFNVFYPQPVLTIFDKYRTSPIVNGF
jgi:hypothetical protein